MTLNKENSRVDQAIVLALVGLAMIGIGWMIMFSGQMFGAVVELAGIVAVGIYAHSTKKMAKSRYYKAWKKHTGSRRIIWTDAFATLALVAGVVGLVLY